MKRKRDKIILGCGAESKGVFSLSNGDALFTSKDFGSLSDYGNFSRYKRRVAEALKRLGSAPEVISCDMHPGYQSTEFAQGFSGGGPRIVKVQHHHAHIASCMMENAVKGRVIGVAFDGTGYGPDGAVWGGEFLLASIRDYKRAAYLKYIPMPGGEMAVTEPWRMAAAYLEDAFGPDLLKIDIPLTGNIKAGEWAVLRHMIDNRINSPMTSSMGRLFDAAAAIILGVPRVSFEAEAAIKLQRAAEKAPDEEKSYAFGVKRSGALVIDASGIIKGIVGDLISGADKSAAAARFHNTVAKIITDICGRLRKSAKTKKVVLSGGVFQNSLLTNKAAAMLKKAGFNVYTHKLYSTTDAGISLGQIGVAGARS
jgi:hydrogenase maturation protein HypF